MAVTADEAWPNRPPPEPPPSPDEIARACAIHAACLPEDAVLLGRYRQTQQCAYGSWLYYAPAERVIPYAYSMYWPRFISFINEAESDCTFLNDLPRWPPWLDCEEDGCWTTMNNGTVTCEGETAMFSAYDTPRDCTLSGMLCDETSPTGCTDRPLTRCENGGRDRCDGSIKLGCDRCGFVSYHDCAYSGNGSCVETEDGAHCEHSGDCENAPKTCTGTALTLCAAGQLVSVDCTEVGMADCSLTPYYYEEADPHCVPLEPELGDASAPDSSSRIDGDASAARSGDARPGADGSAMQRN